MMPTVSTPLDSLIKPYRSPPISNHVPAMNTDSPLWGILVEQPKLWEKRTVEVPIQVLEAGRPMVRKELPRRYTEALRIPRFIDFDISGAEIRFWHKFDFAPGDGGQVQYFRANWVSWVATPDYPNWYGNANFGG